MAYLIQPWKVSLFFCILWGYFLETIETKIKKIKYRQIRVITILGWFFLELGKIFCSLPLHYREKLSPFKSLTFFFGIFCCDKSIIKTIFSSLGIDFLGVESDIFLKVTDESEWNRNDSHLLFHIKGLYKLSSRFFQILERGLNFSSFDTYWVLTFHLLIHISTPFHKVHLILNP